MAVFSEQSIVVDEYGQVIERPICEGNYTLIPDFNIQMVEILGGTAVIGSHEYEHGRALRESLPYLKDIAPFHLSRHLVTQTQWKKICELAPINRELPTAPSRFKGGNRPVESISWEEAVEACDRLTEAFGALFRLPSEAEWEYACRAGRLTPFAYGATLTTEVANYVGVDKQVIEKEQTYLYKGTYANESVGIDRKETTVAGMFPPNGFGLYDMHGNVWEWCDITPFDEEDWERMPLKGGSWSSMPTACRSAFTQHLDPSFRLDCVGFRIAADRRD